MSEFISWCDYIVSVISGNYILSAIVLFMAVSAGFGIFHLIQLLKGDSHF